MPITAYLTGNTDVSDLAIRLPRLLPSQEPAVVGVGFVIQAILQFVIVAFVLFLLVRAVNRLHLDLGSAPVPEDVKLLREIRDALVKKDAKPT